MNLNVITSNSSSDQYLDTDASWEFRVSVDALGHLLIEEEKGTNTRLVAAYPPGQWLYYVASHHVQS